MVPKHHSTLFERSVPSIDGVINNYQDSVSKAGIYSLCLDGFLKGPSISNHLCPKASHSVLGLIKVPHGGFFSAARRHDMPEECEFDAAGHRHLP